VQVFYLQLTHGVVTVTDIQAIADAMDGYWNTNIKPQVTPDVVMQGIDIVYINAVGSEIVYKGSYNRVGTNADTTVSDASAAYVINWAIAAYYRGGHPRSYLPGVANGAVSAGSNISSGARTNLATAWNAFRNAVNTLTTTNVSAIVMGTLSFQTGNAWRGAPVFRPFTSVSVRNKLGSQRRRILT
jgi:hypothetical protein